MSNYCFIDWFIKILSGLFDLCWNVRKCPAIARRSLKREISFNLSQTFFCVDSLYYMCYMSLSLVKCVNIVHRSKSFLAQNRSKSVPSWRPHLGFTVQHKCTARIWLFCTVSDSSEKLDFHIQGYISCCLIWSMAQKNQFTANVDPCQCAFSTSFSG